ncbi:MAG: elongation factor P [Bacilli bacterium]|nr:elongation factor P [Bacilli bacterium]
MVSSNEFKTGLTIEYEGNIYQIIEFQHVKPGKGQAFVRTKMRNLRSGATIDYSFNAGEKIKKANIEKKKMQYLYNTGDAYSFMDMESYEQLDLPIERLEFEKNFLLEGMEVTIISFQEEILGINLPEKVTLKVVDCAPGVKGNTAANATKEAIVETGYRVLVPLFIENDDLIVISTLDGKYNSRA